MFGVPLGPFLQLLVLALCFSAAAPQYADVSSTVVECPARFCMANGMKCTRLSRPGTGITCQEKDHSWSGREMCDEWHMVSYVASATEVRKRRRFLSREPSRRRLMRRRKTTLNLTLDRVRSTELVFCLWSHRESRISS